MLTGRQEEKILSRGHDKLSVFDIVDDEEAALIKPVSRHLLLKDALRNTEHGGLMFGPEARSILKGEEEVDIVEPPKHERKRRRSGSSPNPVGDPLFDALRKKTYGTGEGSECPALCNIPRQRTARYDRLQTAELVRTLRASRNRGGKA